MHVIMRLLAWSVCVVMLVVVEPANTTLPCAPSIRITNATGPPGSAFVIRDCGSVIDTVTINNVTSPISVSIINSSIAAMTIASTNGLSLLISSCIINNGTNINGTENTPLASDAITLVASNMNLTLRIQNCIYTIGAAFFITGGVAGSTTAAAAVSGNASLIAISDTSIVVGQVQAIFLRNAVNVAIVLSRTSINASAAIVVQTTYSSGTLVAVSSIISVANMTGGSISVINGSVVSAVVSCRGQGLMNASVLFFPLWTSGTSSSTAALTVSDSNLSFTQTWNQDVTSTYHTIFMLSMTDVSLVCQRSVLALQYAEKTTTTTDVYYRYSIVPTFTFLTGTMILQSDSQTVLLQDNRFTVLAIYIFVPGPWYYYYSAYIVKVSAISSWINAGLAAGGNGTSVVVARNEFRVDSTVANNGEISAVTWLGWTIGNVECVTVTNNSWVYSTTRASSYTSTWFGGQFTNAFVGSLMVLGNSITSQLSSTTQEYIWYYAAVFVDAKGVGATDGSNPVMMAFNQMMLNVSPTTSTTYMYAAISSMSLNGSCAQYLAPLGWYQRIICGNAFFMSTAIGRASLLGSNADWNQGSIAQFNRLESRGSALNNYGYYSLWVAAGRLRGGAIQHNSIIFDRVTEAYFSLLSVATIDGADASQTSLVTGNVVVASNDSSARAFAETSAGSCESVPSSNNVTLAVCNNTVLATNTMTYMYASLIKSITVLSPLVVESNILKMYGIPQSIVNVVGSMTIDSLLNAYIYVLHNVVFIAESSTSTNVVLVSSMSYKNASYSEALVIGNTMLAYTNASVAAGLVPSPLPLSSLNCSALFSTNVSLLCNNTMQIRNTPTVGLFLCSGCSARNSMTVTVEQNMLIAIDDPRRNTTQSGSWRMALSFNWCLSCAVANTGTLVVKSNEARLLGMQSVSFGVISVQVNDQPGSNVLWAAGNVVYATQMVSGLTIMSPGSSRFPASMAYTLYSAAGCSVDGSLFPSTFSPTNTMTSMVCNNSLIAWQCNSLNIQLCQSCSIQGQALALITNNVILVESTPSLSFAWCSSCAFTAYSSNATGLLMAHNTLSADNISTSMYLNNLFSVYKSWSNAARGTVSLSGNLVAISGVTNASPPLSSSCLSPLWNETVNRVGIICNNTIFATRVSLSASVSWVTIINLDSNTDFEVRDNVVWFADIPRADFSLGSAYCVACQRIRMFNNSCKMTNISQVLSGAILQYASTDQQVIITGNTLILTGGGEPTVNSTIYVGVCAQTFVSSSARGICVSGNTWALLPTTTPSLTTSPATFDVALMRGIKPSNNNYYYYCSTFTVYGNQLSIIANDSTTRVSILVFQQSCSQGFINVSMSNNGVSLLLSSSNKIKANATQVSVVFVSGLYMRDWSGISMAVFQNTMQLLSTITNRGVQNNYATSSLVVVFKLLSSVASTSSYINSYGVSLTNNTMIVQDVNGRGSSITVQVCDQCSIFPVSYSSMQMFQNTIFVTSSQNSFADSTTASVSMCSGCNVYGSVQMSYNAIQVAASTSWIAFVATSVITNQPSLVPILFVSNNSVTAANASIRSEIMGCYSCTEWSWVEFTANTLCLSVQSTSSISPPLVTVIARVFLHMGTYGNATANSVDVFVSVDLLPIAVQIDLVTLPRGPLFSTTGNSPIVPMGQVVKVEGNRIHVSQQTNSTSGSISGKTSVIASLVADKSLPSPSTVINPLSMYRLAIGLIVQMNTIEIEASMAIVAIVVSNYNVSVGVMVEDLVLLRLRQSVLFANVTVTNNTIVQTNTTRISRCGVLHVGATSINASVMITDNNSVVIRNVTVYENTTFVSISYVHNGSMVVGGNLYAGSSEQSTGYTFLSSVCVVLVQLNDSSWGQQLVVQNNSVRLTGTTLNENVIADVELVVLSYSIPRNLVIFGNTIVGDGARGFTAILAIITNMFPSSGLARNATVASNNVSVASSVDTCTIQGATVDMVRLPWNTTTNTTATSVIALHLSVADNVFVCLAPRNASVTMAICCVSPTINVSIVNNTIVSTVTKTATYSTVVTVLTLRTCQPMCSAAVAPRNLSICVTKTFGTVVEFPSGTTVTIEDALLAKPNFNASAPASLSPSCDWIAHSNRITDVVFNTTDPVDLQSAWWSYSFAVVGSIMNSVGCVKPTMYVFNNNLTGVTIPFAFVSFAPMQSVAIYLVNNSSPVGMGSVRVTLIGTAAFESEIFAESTNLGQIYVFGSVNSSRTSIFASNCSVSQLSLKGSLAYVNVSLRDCAFVAAVSSNSTIVSDASLQRFPVIDLASLSLSDSVINIENAMWTTLESTTTTTSVARHSFVAMNQTFLSNVSLAVATINSTVLNGWSPSQVNISEALLVAADCVTIASSTVVLSVYHNLVAKNIMQFSWGNTSGNALSSCPSFVLQSSTPSVVTDSVISVKQSKQILATSDAISLSHVSWINVQVDIDPGTTLTMMKSDPVKMNKSVVSFDGNSRFINASILFDNVVFVNYDQLLKVASATSASSNMNSSNLTVSTACVRWYALHKSVVLHDLVLGSLEHLYEPLCFSRALGAACPCHLSLSAKVTSSLWTSPSSTSPRTRTNVWTSSSSISTSLTRTNLLTPSSSTSSSWEQTVSSSVCGEIPLCHVQSEIFPTAEASGFRLCRGIEGCVVLQPPPVGTSQTTGEVLAQISREALDVASSNGQYVSLLVLMQCTRPVLLRLVNGSTSTPAVIVRSSNPQSPQHVDSVSVMLSFPRGMGIWLTRSPYRTFLMEFSLPAECEGQALNVMLTVAVTPRSVPLLAVGVAVHTTDSVVMMLGASVGGASGGGSVSRVAAMRSLLLCSKEGASTGGILGLSLARALDGGDELLQYARGAVVGNMVVLALWLAMLLAIAAVYYYRVGRLEAATASVSAACARLALPSSLLPVCSALVPSLSGGVLILAVSSPLDAVDMAAVVAGTCLLVAMLIPLLWLCAPSFATAILDVFLAASSDGGHNAKHGDRHGNETWKASAALLWREVVNPRWEWRPLMTGVLGQTGGGKLLDRYSLAARRCSMILSEYRFMWYLTLDMWLLCVCGLLAAASGVIESHALCNGAAIALSVLFLLQFAVCVLMQPLTSVFANVTTSFVLLLTGLGTILQTVSIARRQTTSDVLEEWALLGSAICGFLVSGVSMAKLALVDRPHIVSAGWALLREISTARDIKEGSGSTPEQHDQALFDPGCEPDETADCELDVIHDALDSRFWDKLTGKAIVLIKEDDCGCNMLLCVDPQLGFEPKIPPSFHGEEAHLLFPL